MVAELGHMALALSACLALAAAGTGLLANRPEQLLLRRATVSMTIGQFVFVALAFVVLVSCFVADDFSVAYVANHSNSLLPWYYKVSATWGGHEGSFLLWTLINSGWMLMVALRGQHYPATYVNRSLGVLSLLNLGFICFALFTSNPFERLIPLTPADGADLNPLLQDFGLIVHPPLLYVGYVGLAVPFSFAVAAMLENRVDAAWARWSRPWTNVAWAALTLGIALGSWWAYYELGWGGWWFWDPVENASFMPWLAATALLHSLAVTEKRGIFKSWTLLLAIAAFSLSLLGGFIVRSGVLTSVHAFAVDPERGLYILIFLATVVGSSLALYAVRGGGERPAVGFALASREFFMLLNNVVLVLALAVVLWGTLAPIGYEALTGDRISIGVPFFNTFFIPLMLALGAALALVPMLNWKRTRWGQWRSALVQALPTAAVVGGGAWYFMQPRLATVLVAIVLALWILATHGRDLLQRLRSRGTIPLSYWGMLMAHVGFAVSLVGIAVTATQSLEEDVRMAPGDSRSLGTATVVFEGIENVAGPNYRAQQGRFEVRQADGDSFSLFPQKRQYLAGGSVMTEAAIDPGLFADTYISLGEPLGDDAWAVRLHYKPLVRWVWLGCILMALGGLVAVMDVRYRRLRRRDSKLVPAQSGELSGGPA